MKDWDDHERGRDDVTRERCAAPTEKVEQSEQKLTLKERIERGDYYYHITRFFSVRGDKMIITSFKPNTSRFVRVDNEFIQRTFVFSITAIREGEPVKYAHYENAFIKDIVDFARLKESAYKEAKKLLLEMYGAI